MTEFLSTFFTGFALSAALIVAIGAQNLFVLRQGLRGEHVLPVVLFCGTADAILIAIGVGGAGALIAELPGMTGLLTLGGAAFLAWYGGRALLRVADPQAMAAGSGDGAIPLGQALMATAGFTLLNPHVYLDTVLLMGAAGSTVPAAVRPVFVAGAATASFAWFGALGFGARLLAPLFARPAAWRVLDALVGVTMLALAATLVVRALA